MFHLVNHAFFKALLFLSAGAVIHALNDEQDMRKMGGLFKILPFTYVMILIGSLALMGFPFLTGFYSKDVILELAASKFNFSSGFAYWLGVFFAFFTAFYSFRLINLTFLKKTNSYKSSIENAHDAPILMALPLYLLAFFSIFFGYIFKDLFIGLGTRMWGNSIYINSLNFNMIEAEFLPVSIKLIPLFFSFFGAILSLFLYLICYNVLCKLQKIPVLNKLFVFLNKRWYFDIIYTKFITQPVLNFGYKISFKLIDRGFIELLGPLGLTRFFSNLSFYVNSIQSGYIFEYAAFIVIGVILFLGLLFNFIPFISIAEADLNILFIFSLILSQILI
jgi:NADH-ubiquinone oxidoreductase chain 5